MRFQVKVKKGEELTAEDIHRHIRSRKSTPEQGADERSRFSLLPPMVTDKATAFQLYGFGGRVSPDNQGFFGLFRQRWQDFHVTEMPEAGVRLQRTVDDTIPSVVDFFNSLEKVEDDPAGSPSEDQGSTDDATIASSAPPDGTVTKAQLDRYDPTIRQDY